MKLVYSKRLEKRRGFFAPLFPPFVVSKFGKQLHSYLREGEGATTEGKGNKREGHNFGGHLWPYYCIKFKYFCIFLFRQDLKWQQTVQNIEPCFWRAFKQSSRIETQYMIYDIYFAKSHKCILYDDNMKEIWYKKSSLSLTEISVECLRIHVGICVAPLLISPASAAAQRRWLFWVSRFSFYKRRRSQRNQDWSTWGVGPLWPPIALEHWRWRGSGGHSGNNTWQGTHRCSNKYVWILSKERKLQKCKLFLKRNLS